MADTYLVQVDLPRLRAHLAAATGRTWSDQDVRAELLDAGFRPDPRGGWVAESICLRWLAADEILSTTPLD